MLACACCQHDAESSIRSLKKISTLFSNHDYDLQLSHGLNYVAVISDQPYAASAVILIGITLTILGVIGIVRAFTFGKDVKTAD